MEKSLEVNYIMPYKKKSVNKKNQVISSQGTTFSEISFNVNTNNYDSRRLSLLY